LFRLAMAQAQAGEVQLGIHNMKRVAELAPEQPQVWTALGQLLIAATPDGTVPPEAVVDFNKALALDPKAAMPRFLLGQAKVESGDVAGGVAMWRALQSEMPPGGEAAKAMDQFIAKAEGGGGAAAPAAAPAGPQSDMIQGMVASLAAKLKQNPNDVDGWSRLIRSYAVLGDTAKMNAALEEARRIFKDRPSDRARIESAADKPQ
ncbi:MAG TPA: c-type cytochrome biogenesis protein CcmI, partial [Caulobacteraceae bacterium]|nr:c-type cytochrome biogenesis protein CcmI [Caulobacteraceae bacterium]